LVAGLSLTDVHPARIQAVPLNIENDPVIRHDLKKTITLARAGENEHPPIITHWHTSPKFHINILLNLTKYTSP